ncbi:MAG: hypothetical protein WBM44_18485, partial [Waterburya sp.]
MTKSFRLKCEFFGQLFLRFSIKLAIALIYYPFYHSKYNPTEQCWALLENYWNGTILDSVKT